LFEQPVDVVFRKVHGMGGGLPLQRRPPNNV
jgi:hypothetical protein